MEKVILFVAQKLKNKLSNKDNKDESEINVVMICLSALLLLTCMVIYYILSTPLQDIMTDIPDVVKIAQELKNNNEIASDVIGGDVGIDEAGLIASNMSSEELEEFMNQEDVADAVKIAVAFCHKYIGFPYSQAQRISYDSKGSNLAFDCSSFVWYAYREAGLLLSDTQGYHAWPPTASLEAKWCSRHGCVIKDINQAQAGDLLFFSRDSAKAEGRYMDIGHVAMCIGNGKIIHAKGTKYGVVCNNINKYDRTFVFIGRPVLTKKT